MKNFHIEVITCQGDIPKYIKVWFNGSDSPKDVVEWIKSLDCVHHVNLHESKNFKYEAIVYHSKCYDIEECKNRLQSALDKYYLNR